MEQDFRTCLPRSRALPERSVSSEVQYVVSMFLTFPKTPEIFGA